MMGFKYYEDLKERIPRKEIDDAKKKISKILKKIDKDCIFEICGSYRRGQETSGDMDVIISNPKYVKGIAEQNYLKRVVEMGVTDGFVIDHLTEKGDKKYMGFCKIKKRVRRIDIRVFDYESFWGGILYFTGNKEFNIKIRNRAIEKGLSLNEYGLTNISTGEKILLNSEEEIFTLLEIPYQSPIERNISFS
jgi:DNA polymerase beta